ncbi:MAG: hypothetical protein ACRDTD_12875 [Pseudonocardiaceae bacterium]
MAFLPGHRLVRDSKLGDASPVLAVSPPSGAPSPQSSRPDASTVDRLSPIGEGGWHAVHRGAAAAGLLEPHLGAASAAQRWVFRGRGGAGGVACR